MEVKEYLGQAKHLNLLLDAKLDQIRKLKSQEEKAAITLNDVNEKANTLRRFKQMTVLENCVWKIRLSLSMPVQRDWSIGKSSVSI